MSPEVQFVDTLFHAVAAMRGLLAHVDPLQVTRRGPKSRRSRGKVSDILPFLCDGGRRMFLRPGIPAARFECKHHPCIAAICRHNGGQAERRQGAVAGRTRAADGKRPAAIRTRVAPSPASPWRRPTRPIRSVPAPVPATSRERANGSSEDPGDRKCSKPENRRHPISRARPFDLARYTSAPARLSPAMRKTS